MSEKCRVISRQSFINYDHLHSSFITYRSCKHLDGKHTVFGKLVGGLDTLANVERVETDNKDRPIEDLYIEKTIVFVDPFTEVDEEVSHFDEFQTSVCSHTDSLR